MVQSNLGNTGFTVRVLLYLALSLVKVLKGNQTGLKSLEAGANMRPWRPTMDWALLHHSLIKMMLAAYVAEDGLVDHQ